MQNLNWLMLFAFLLGGFCTADSSNRDRGVSSISRKRFLFETFCYGSCNLRCTFGYQRSNLGCSLCKCVGSSVVQSAQLSPNSNHFVPSNFSSNAGHIGLLFNNPCDPSVRHCPLRCTIGYKEGSNGCQMCACIEKQQTTTMAVSQYPGTNGCQMCACIEKQQTTTVAVSQLPTVVKVTSPPNIRLTTTLNTAKPTTTRKGSQTTAVTPTNSHSGYSDPCIPSQIVCNLPCNGDYVLGPDKCQYCLCADKIPPELRQTTTKAPIAPPALGRFNTSFHNSSKMESKPTAEACIMAKVICNEKCPGGFVSKPDDCLYCSCLNTNAVPSDDVIHVTLHQPCLYRSRACRTKCTKGYVKGPRNCQFCSCMK